MKKTHNERKTYEISVAREKKSQRKTGNGKYTIKKEQLTRKVKYANLRSKREEEMEELMKTGNRKY